MSTGETLKILIELIKKQAADEALFAVTPKYASEAYMQGALKELSTAVVDHLTALLTFIDNHVDEAWQAMSIEERKATLQGGIIKALMDWKRDLENKDRLEERALDETKRVRTAFMEYGQHKRKCKWRNPNGVCDCGFAEIANKVQTGEWD